MHTIEVTRKETVAVAALKVEAGVRYWEDGQVNGEPDENGDLMPFASGDLWRPVIDLVDGRIRDWPEGTTAKVHYKVYDAGIYRLLDEEGAEVAMIDGYVPEMLSPGGSGYGDYIIMDIGLDGKIDKWFVDLSPFEADDE